MMVKVEILMVCDTGKLLRVVEQSRGRVLLRLPDGSLCDLKQENAGLEYLKQEMGGCRGVELHLSDEADRPAFLKYLMEAAFG